MGLCPILNLQGCKWKGWGQDDVCDDLDNEDVTEYNTFEEWLKQ
jgi:hypothetical protein